MLARYNRLSDSVNGTQVDSVSDSLLVIFNTVNLGILAGIVASFGIVSNILNIIVFYKHGLSDTVGISLLALAIADLGSLILLEWVSLLNNPLFFYSVPLIAVEIQHLTGAWPHTYFARVNSWITVYITMERCLCVVIPLRVKRVMTPKVAMCACVSIYVVMFLSLLPDYATCYIDWKFDPYQNRSVLGLLFMVGRDKMAALSFFLSAGTQMSSFAAVIVFTVILVVKMNETTKWRRATRNASASNMSELRDKKALKMIVTVAIIYCISFLPMVGTFVVVSVVPGFLAFSVYHNTFFVAWSFAFFFDSINSSVNIFVYYKMSSKYRSTFDSFICIKRCLPQTGSESKETK